MIFRKFDFHLMRRKEIDYRLGNITTDLFSNWRSQFQMDYCWIIDNRKRLIRSIFYRIIAIYPLFNEIYYPKKDQHIKIGAHTEFHWLKNL